jgi:hypothetical protein
MRRLLARLLRNNYRIISFRATTSKGVTFTNGVYTMLGAVDYYD